MTSSGSQILHADFVGPFDVNDRTAILLLHGFTGSTATMSNIAGPLSESRRVVAMDLPGHGRNGAAADVYHYGFDRTVNAVADTLGNLNAIPTHVVGYSMGGRIALALAIRNTDVVSYLTQIRAYKGKSKSKIQN